MMPIELKEVLSFANDLADIARPIALQHFRSPLSIDLKGDSSPVTIADRTIETRLRERIAERYPDHGVFGEEFAQQRGLEYTWVLDPIDGTRAFISGVPLFGTLIALAKGDTPIAGVVDMPAMGERWVGSSLGAFFQGRPAEVSGCTTLSNARVSSTSPDIFTADALAAFDRLTKRAAFRRFGGDCYSYGLLASGHCDLVIEQGLKPYDYMALVPIIEAAGGFITDWAGEPLTFGSDGKVIAAATRELLEECLIELRGG